MYGSSPTCRRQKWADRIGQGERGLGRDSCAGEMECAERMKRLTESPNNVRVRIRVNHQDEKHLFNFELCFKLLKIEINFKQIILAGHTENM